MKILFANEELVLRSDKTIYWPNGNTLFVADLHLGKVAHFRKNGSGIPEIGFEPLLVQLQNALQETTAKKLIILGDFFHSIENNIWQELQNKWKIQAEQWLVPGNHDIIPLEKYNMLGIEIKPELTWLEPFTLCHAPPLIPLKDQFYLSGHVHPGVRIQGKARQQLRFPCYHLTSQVLTLPAAGLFTGLHTVRKIEKDDLAIAVTDNQLIKLKNF